MTKSLYITTTRETVLPITYIDTYSDPEVRALIHEYKFTNRSVKAQKILTGMLIDICISIILERNGVLIFSSPPSTMYARREKTVDSMWSLLKFVRKQIVQYMKNPLKTCVLYTQIFSIRSTFLKHRRAQHIDGSRKSRTANIQGRYTIRLFFKIRLHICIYMKKQTSFSFYIIDDVVSTGGTLLACKETLTTYVQTLQKKKPELSFDIQVFSLVH